MPFDAQTVLFYARSTPQVSVLLDGKPSKWTAEEVGDGNLNLVFLVHGSTRSICIKQSLPYIRIAQSFALSERRIVFEHAALQEQVKHVPNMVPLIHYFDEQHGAIVMECLRHHTLLRQLLMDPVLYRSHRSAVDIPAQLAAFMARTLFLTSNFALPSLHQREITARFLGNGFMSKVTQEVIFTDPYVDNPSLANRWMAELGPLVQALRRDQVILSRVGQLKQMFMCNTEALLHGDLHTGSVLVPSASGVSSDHHHPHDALNPAEPLLPSAGLTDTSTQNDRVPQSQSPQTYLKVFDAEFAFVGPMGFDIGLLVAHFLIALVRALEYQGGSTVDAVAANAPVDPRSAHANMNAATEVENGTAISDWRQHAEVLTADIARLKHTFDACFLKLWHDKSAALGNAFPSPDRYADEESKQASATPSSSHAAPSRLHHEHVFLDRLWRDAMGFAACEIIRRVVGIAHVADLESITEPIRKLNAESLLLRLSMHILQAQCTLEEALARLTNLFKADLPDNSRALVLVSKLPKVGSSKTRLASTIGSERAAQFAKASLVDLLERLSDETKFEHPFARVLLFAPVGAEPTFKQFMMDDGISPDKWLMLPMIDDNVFNPDLGAKLQAALQRLRSDGFGDVIFVGSDAPDLPSGFINDAFAHMAGSSPAVAESCAYINPAEDGGYVLLGVPARCPAEVFAQVHWSAPDTCISQTKRVLELGIPLRIGPTFDDVDTVDDLCKLAARLRTPEAVLCPRVKDFVAQLTKAGVLPESGVA